MRMRLQGLSARVKRNFQPKEPRKDSVVLEKPQQSALRTPHTAQAKPTLFFRCLWDRPNAANQVLIETYETDLLRPAGGSGLLSVASRKRCCTPQAILTT